MQVSTQAIHTLTETDKGSYFVMETPCENFFNLQFSPSSNRKIYFRAKIFFQREQNVRYDVDGMPKTILIYD